MKVRILACHSVELIAAEGGATRPEGDGYYYIEVPDDTASFLSFVARWGSFEVTAPGGQSPDFSPALIRSKSWTLNFQNDRE